MNQQPNSTLNRRAFLVRTGWLAAGTTVLTGCSSIIPALPSTKDPVAEDGLAWIQIMPDGRVRFYCPRMEMGQGAPLGLTQIVAEELNVGQEAIDCITPATDQVPPFKMTVGSEGVSQFAEPLARASAQLREALRARAAGKLGVPPAKVADATGGFAGPDGSVLAYGTIAGQSGFSILEADMSAKPKPADRHHTVGQRWRHPDLQAIVTGQMTYSRDIVVEGMAYGDVLRPPAFGAELLRADADKARAMEGVVAVVIDEGDNFVGIVTENPFILDAALHAIQADWSRPAAADPVQTLDADKPWDEDDFEHEILSDGSIQAGRDEATDHLSHRYDTPFAAHAAMEPRAAIAKVSGGKAEIWCGSQDPYFVRGRVCRVVGLDEDDVVVHPHRMGGGFGGRVPCQASEEAARLSAAVGRPVRVQWDRETEFRHNYFQPAFSHRIAAGIDGSGRIRYWDHGFVSSPIIFGLVPKPLSYILDLFVADEGTARGATLPYAPPSRRVRYSDVRTQVPTGSWRGLGAAPNTFAIESMVDELAAEARMDPLAFRLQNLPKDQGRLAAVLQTVARDADWGRPQPASIGMGIAGAIYKGETYAAIVAKVSVDRAAETIRVNHVWCAQDCGRVVNPDQVESQIAGNIAWGCSMALKEQVPFDGGQLDVSNFDGYDVLRHDDAPNISITLIDPAKAAPSGVGESAFGPVAAAIANAVFAATGHRFRKLPITYDDIVPATAS